ncbi:MAG: DUF4886 domain-containing protein [Maribacter sp.]
MRNILLLIIGLLTFSCQSQKKEKIEDVNVLFIGNSLTYYHDMPKTVQAMLNETDPNIKIEQSTFPGMSLAWHLENIIESRTEDNINTRKKFEGEKTETEIKITEKNWDVVILQEGTVNLLIPEVRDFTVNKAIGKIKTLVDNPECKFIFFTTWPSKRPYPKEYCRDGGRIDESLDEMQDYCSPKIENYEQEFKLVENGHSLIAKRNGMEKTDNGILYRMVKENKPDLTLLEDPIHPNANGAFLNACEFYEILSGKKASKLKVVGQIDPNVAEYLKSIAGKN